MPNPKLYPGPSPLRDVVQQSMERNFGALPTAKPLLKQNTWVNMHRPPESFGVEGSPGRALDSAVQNLLMAPKAPAQAPPQAAPAPVGTSPDEQAELLRKRQLAEQADPEAQYQESQRKQAAWLAAHPQDKFGNRE